MATTKYTTSEEGDYLRITASTDFTLIDGTQINEGDDGGLIASEDCLDNDLDNGTCWVWPDGLVKNSDARISDNAIIGNHVQIDDAPAISGNIKLYGNNSDCKLIIKDNGKYDGYGYIVTLSGEHEVTISGDDTDIQLISDSFDDGKYSRDNGLFFHNIEENVVYQNIKAYGDTRIECFRTDTIVDSKITSSYVHSSSIRNSKLLTNRLHVYSKEDTSKEYNSGSYWLFHNSYSSLSTSTIDNSTLDNVEFKLMDNDSIDTCAIQVIRSTLKNVTNKNIDDDEFNINKPIYMYQFNSINNDTVEISSGVFKECTLRVNSNNKFKSFVTLESDYIDNIINIRDTTIDDSELEDSVTGYNVSDSNVRVLYSVYSYRKAGMYFNNFKGSVYKCYLSTKTHIGRYIDIAYCSVKDNAMVLDKVRIRGVDKTYSVVNKYAKIKDEVILNGRFYISGSSTVKDLARINGNIKWFKINILDNATVSEHAYLEGSCYLQDNALIGGNAIVTGDGANYPTIRYNGIVLGNAELHNKVYVYRNSIVDGNAILRDNVGVYNQLENNSAYIKVTGNAFLSDGAYFVTPAYIDDICRQDKTYFSEYLYNGILVTELDEYLRIGYAKKTWNEWKSLTRDNFNTLFNHGADFYDRYWDYLKSKLPKLN